MQNTIGTYARFNWNPINGMEKNPATVEPRKIGQLAKDSGQNGKECGDIIEYIEHAHHL